MNVHQLRRWSDKVDGGLRSTGDAAKSGISSVYNGAVSNPRTTAAVVLGTGVAAALLWLAKRNGASSSRRKAIAAHARGNGGRRSRAAR